MAVYLILRNTVLYHHETAASMRCSFPLHLMFNYRVPLIVMDGPRISVGSFFVCRSVPTAFISPHVRGLEGTKEERERLFERRAREQEALLDKREREERAANSKL